MNLFSANKEKKSIITYFPIFIMLAVLCAFVIFSNSLSSSNTSHEKEILANAIDRSITQCYALEGMYPSSLSYLEEHYGLIYNKKQFYVDYQYIGGNLRPDITIIERN